MNDLCFAQPLRNDLVSSLPIPISADPFIIVSNGHVNSFNFGDFGNFANSGNVLVRVYSRPNVLLCSSYSLLLIASGLNLRQFFFQKLLVIQIGVVAITRQQLVVSANLHDPALMQHCNLVRGLHC